MSENILQALMQLFAIVAVSSKDEERDMGVRQRATVEKFLCQQVASNQVVTYLNRYDEYYEGQLLRAQSKRKSLKHTSSSSVRVLRICSQINEELHLTQKFIVLARLIEFARLSGGEVEGQEREFIFTVSDSFYVTREELELLLAFVGSESISSTASDGSTPFLQILGREKASQTDESNRMIFREHFGGIAYIHHVARAGLYLLRYLGDQSLLLGGQAVQHGRLYVLSNGSSIRGAMVSPVFYADIIASFTPEGLRNQICFEAKHITYRFLGGNIGLHDVTFSHSGGQMVGIIGSSGAGKSTLLNVLNGNSRPAEGTVLINGTDIYQESKRVQGIIGFVSQDDLLIEELSVFQNLYYSAKLSFIGTGEAKLVELVNDTLLALGLLEVKDLPVGNPLNKRISGGQRKRLNIALELIRQPSILFLDEPTSGLSSRDSESLMLLLKELSLRGKLIYTVIHQPSSDIFKMFDAILMLDTGGYLIYDGDPVESIEYFREQGQHVGVNERECVLCGNVNPEQLFNIVENPVVDEYGNTTHQRRVQPEEWRMRFQEAYRRSSSHVVASLPSIDSIPRAAKTPGWIQQLKVFITRDVLAKIANRQYIGISLLETPVLAVLLAYIIRFYETSTSEASYMLMSNANLPVYLFMAVIVAFFIGLSGSAEEIIKDRKIRKREAFLNLSWGAYLSAKMVNVILLSLYQSFLFTLIGNAILGIQGMFFHYWLVLFATWVSAGTLGLMISDTFKTVVAIYILIPFLVIPQIILSGIIVRFDRLNPAVSGPENIPWYGECIIARWAYEALAVQQFQGNAYQKPLYEFEQAMSFADFKKNFWLKELTLRVDRLARGIDPPHAETDWRTLRCELLDDTDPIRGSGIPIVEEALQRTQPDSASLSYVSDHLKRLESYYMRMYNLANRQRDSVLLSMQGNSPEARAAFIALKQNHYNTALSLFVRMNDQVERIVPYRNRLLQRYDAIFQLPRSRFLKTHFYAPYKRIGDLYLNTYWVNVGILLLSVVATYLLLYLRVPKRLLDWLAKLF